MSLPLLRVAVVLLILAGSTSAPPARAQDPSPLARIEALGLDTARVGRVTAYFAPADRDRAEAYAALADEAAAFYERELGLSFPFHLAVLAPEHWFTPYAGGDLEPYGMPWSWSRSGWSLCLPLSTRAC